MQDQELNAAMQTAKNILTALKIYHRYEVVGLEHIPRRGPAMLVNHHSLATYDGFILGMEIFDKAGRLTKGLGDDLLFKLPVTKNWVGDLGIVPASPDKARELLEAGEILGLAPGGMRESLRPSDQKYQVRWGKRKGFIRLAIETQVPIILAACPRADDIFTVYENPLTAMVYKKFKMPLPVFRGMGLSLIPRPIKLIHYLSEPLFPPPYQVDFFERDVEVFHQVVLARMKKLLSLR